MFGIILAAVSAFCARKNLHDISCSFLKVLGTKVEVIYKDKEAFDNLDRQKGIVFIANHQR